MRLHFSIQEQTDHDRRQFHGDQVKRDFRRKLDLAGFDVGQRDREGTGAYRTVVRRDADAVFKCQPNDSTQQREQHDRNETTDQNHRDQFGQQLPAEIAVQRQTAFQTDRQHQQQADHVVGGFGDSEVRSHDTGNHAEHEKHDDDIRHGGISEFASV